jgi:hypothetical protein
MPTPAPRNFGYRAVFAVSGLAMFACLFLPIGSDPTGSTPLDTLPLATTPYLVALITLACAFVVGRRSLAVATAVARVGAGLALTIVAWSISRHVVLGGLEATFLTIPFALVIAWRDDRHAFQLADGLVVAGAVESLWFFLEATSPIPKLAAVGTLLGALRWRHTIAVWPHELNRAMRPARAIIRQ